MYCNVSTGSSCLLIRISLSLSLSICVQTMGTKAVIQFSPNREILALLEEVLCIGLQGMLEQMYIAGNVKLIWIVRQEDLPSSLSVCSYLLR